MQKACLLPLYKNSIWNWLTLSYKIKKIATSFILIALRFNLFSLFEFLVISILDVYKNIKPYSQRIEVTN